VKNDFHQFVLEEFGGDFTDLGYRLKGGSFTKPLRGVRAIATFMRYHDRLRPMFNVRLQIAFTDQPGVVLASDLSTLIGIGSNPKEWCWPLAGDDRRRISAEISEALRAQGLPWLERLIDPTHLAGELEANKRVTPESDAQRDAIMAALGAAGVTVAHQSPGFSTSHAGKIIPNKVKALSFCYQLTEEWERALGAWDDYATTCDTRLPPYHAEAIALRERRAFLAEKCGIGPPSPG
jgi:hypothetical protein